ncbi:hypothetical protein Sjap_002647 [Stephania japonica]|uniref:Cyclin-like domain-containing protein n=1 Tax=Stephania japonica TaxID=461633 RepID=A0AAP0PST5_9MAGN
MNSKSRRVLVLKVFVSAAATSLKKKNNIQTNTIPKNVAFIVSNECNLEKTPSDERSDTSISTQDAYLGTKRVRRQYFTSSFMERLVEKLPNIDDDRNPLEVSAYIDDIYQYYWVMEVHFKYELMPETLFLMVALFDQFLSVVKIAKSEIQLVGLTALLLASKYEDFWHPRIKELIRVSAGSYTSAPMLGMKLIPEKLMFRLNIPTPYVFMLRFLKAAQSDRKHGCRFSANKHTEESQLRDCANMILKFQKVASTGPLMVTYEKYAHPEHSRVAEITSIEKLPQ